MISVFPVSLSNIYTACGKATVLRNISYDVQNLYFRLPRVIFDTINTKTIRFIENSQATSIYYMNYVEMLIYMPLKSIITSCVYRKYEDSLVTI